ncbi:hypothetical protein [Amycolatopsis sp. YIM 10]|uniref:hypothetical protein n=1 Tax=Amycolatopsis sp. YIM 10 TaxID=2653857 RepID=UPI00129081F3|nr:hypothetical protein [Amycolatopsis sp. YIM 10]QFU92716.1 Spore-associated protein A precursor [Amycolatopsis sp. YIM 10]
MKLSARLSSLAAATAMATAGLAIAAPSASAHSESDLSGICGGGYSIVSDAGGIDGKAKRPVRTPAGTRWGYVYLLYNSGNGNNCVVTLKTTFHGTPSLTNAVLWVQGRDNPYVDQGDYSHYADVQAKGDNKCVAYSGAIANPNNSTVATGGRPEWGNCG